MESQAFLTSLTVDQKKLRYYDITQLQDRGFADISRLPYAIRILVENVLRKMDGKIVTEADLTAIAHWQPHYDSPREIPFHPARVLMQDFTGVPAVVDLAAMRDAVRDLGGDPTIINPLVPVELIVDHSIQVDAYGRADCMEENVAREYERNGERYQLLKWAQQSFANFKVVPPNAGICHQVNLEYMGRVVCEEQTAQGLMAFPDTLVGTDSHTPMINGIGVLGWGVGGIEAEAVMLGQPYVMSIPEIIGVRMTGRLKKGVTATDLVLTLTEMLRNHGVVEKIIEYFGPGLKHLAVTDRATIANMTPENGATSGFFPVDEQTLNYVRSTNRKGQARLIEAYTKAAGLFYSDQEHPEYSEVLEFDLGSVAPSLAGPARPQDRIRLGNMKKAFAQAMGCAYDRDTDVTHMSRFQEESGSLTHRAKTCQPVSQRQVDINLKGRKTSLGDGNVVIAAITSCTNTSNPHVMIGAGLLAKAAVEKSLQVPPFVKTSLAPGSKVVTRYLEKAGLMPFLEQLGFYLAAFGCTTCIGNSGPLEPSVEKAIADNNLNVAAVLSGNRNFEARIHQAIKSNYLASPLLVVAFALAGRVDIDMNTEPLGHDAQGQPVYLDDIWPEQEAIAALVKETVNEEFYTQEYGRIFDGDDHWRHLAVTESTTYAWDETSTYIRKPPFFDGFKLARPKLKGIDDARVLMVLGDSVTTDHISPAGAIAKDYPAGQYLQGQGVAPMQFNSYGSRRGNHEVMMRGTFGNIRIKNQLVAPKEGSWTKIFPRGDDMYVYDAAMAYADEHKDLLVIGGKEYGSGSSRDWAAKGPLLLGVRAVLAESYERIHRNNLVGMGILPLVFTNGQNAASLGIDGNETFSIDDWDEAISPRKTVHMHAKKPDGQTITFEALVRLDTDVDVAYFENGGILPYVLRKLLAEEN